MQLLCNGQPLTIEADIPLLLLLRSLSIEAQSVVVELNDTLYRYPQFKDLCLSDGDRLEIVQFVGGG